MAIIDFINKSFLEQFRVPLNQKIGELSESLNEKGIPIEGSFKIELLRKELDEKIWELLLKYINPYTPQKQTDFFRTSTGTPPVRAFEEEDHYDDFGIFDYADYNVKIKEEDDDGYQSGLSDQAKYFIDQSNIILQQFKDSGDDIDYSACAIGIWKAIEWELNLVFIDWLRSKNRVCYEQPTQGSPSKRPGKKVFIPSGRRYNGTEHTININITNFDGTLLGIMLYYISKLLEYSENNDLKQLLDGRLSELRNDLLGIDENGLPKQILRVTQEYRNRYVHCDGMGLDVFNEFRNFVFNDTEDGMINKIIRYKRLIYD